MKQIEQYLYLAFGEEHALAGIIADVFAKNDIHPQISSVTDDVQTLVYLVAIGEGYLAVGDFNVKICLNASR